MDDTTLPPSYLIASATDAAAVLTNMRVARGWRGEELDDFAGLQDRYTAKLENPTKPWGKAGLHISAMWELWADALGMCLVLMPQELALRIGAQPAPERQPSPWRTGPARAGKLTTVTHVRRPAAA